MQVPNLVIRQASCNSLSGTAQQLALLSSNLITYQSLRNVVIGTLVVSVTGLLLGRYTSFLVDIWGRSPIQFIGFAMLALLLAVLVGELTSSRVSRRSSLILF